MSIKINSKNGQVNRYEFFSGGKHTHDFYDSKTGKMGSHGENCSEYLKKRIGKLSENDTCRGGK